ncbi:MAG: hypothetical protein Q4C58_11390 [Eubacteriales bacterium]|nr:hypothetical protein [Eubacteriales bacterium]
MKKCKAKRNNAGKSMATRKAGHSLQSRRQPTVNRNHKDRLFRLIFSEKKNLLQLYNAIRGSNYDNPDDLTITTNEDVIYLGMKNDVSFLIDDVLNLYEHQASFNPNMGLRGFLYLADSFRKYIESNRIYIYGSKAVKLPVPQYVVFYNGTKEEPDKLEIRLSDLFDKTAEIQPCIEVTAIMLNINRGHNRALMDKCSILWEYAEFIGRIRENQVNLSLENAVNEAIESSIRDGILAGFLKAHRAEVIEVVLTEYDEKGYIEYEKQLSREEGELSKLVQLVCKKLSKGKSPVQIAEDLEENLKTVTRICDVACPFAPNYDCDQIVSKIMEQNILN